MWVTVHIHVGYSPQYSQPIGVIVSVSRCTTTRACLCKTVFHMPLPYQKDPLD